MIRSAGTQRLRVVSKKKPASTLALLQISWFFLCKNVDRVIWQKTLLLNIVYGNQIIHELFLLCVPHISAIRKFRKSGGPFSLLDS